MTAGVTDSTEERKGGHDMMAGLDEGQTNMFRAARKRQISKAPSVLVVSFQRLGRDHPQVQIEERLDIRPFMDLTRYEENNNTNYILIGVISHSQGDYTAYVKAKTCSFGDTWCHANDHMWVKVRDGQVNLSDLWKVCAEEEPHLLFYERVDDPADMSTYSKQVQEQEQVDRQEQDGTHYMTSENQEQPIETVEVNSKTREGGSKLVEENELFLALDNVVKGVHYMTSNKQRQGDENLDFEINYKTREVSSTLVEEKEVAPALDNVVKGMPNLGNSCFFNAVMQNLLALDLMRSSILGPDIWSGSFAMELKRLFLETSSNDVGDTLDQQNLFTSICCKHVQFKGRDMQDSHELLCLFLDDLHMEEAHARQIPEKNATTIINSIFAGETSSTIRSTECMHSTITRDKIYNISLTIPSGDASVSVEDCFHEFVQEEAITGWHCELCPGKAENNERNAMKKPLISETPPKLVVHLKRLSCSNNIFQKLDKHVNFKEILDIRKFMALEKRYNENEKTTYRLVGVVQHVGNARGGHYVAFVRAGSSDTTKSWFKASDNHVRESSLEEALNCQAYLLFYEKTDAPQTLSVDMQLSLVQPPLPSPWIEYRGKRSGQEATEDAKLAQQFQAPR